MTEGLTINRVERWIREVVIGYNLCPFAKIPMARGKVELVCYSGRDLTELKTFLLDKARALAQEDPDGPETSLIICPNILEEFLAYWDYSGYIEQELAATGLEGILQLATFHPDYYFSATDPEAPENYTNRAPYPIFHLLKESSISKALDNYPQPEEIPRRNMEKMNSLGKEFLQSLFDRFKSNEI
jgi:hypothetical protein